MGFWSTVGSIISNSDESRGKVDQGNQISRAAASPRTLNIAGYTLKKSDDPDAQTLAGAVLANHRWEKEAEKSES